MSGLHHSYDIPNLSDPPVGLVFVRTGNTTYLPGNCSEFVGMSLIRAGGEYCGFQIGIGHFLDGSEQLIARGVWSSVASWLPWKAIIGFN